MAAGESTTRNDAGFVVSDGEPVFDLRLVDGTFPRGWVLLSMELKGRYAFAPQLRLETRAGLLPGNVRPLPGPAHGRLETLVHLPSDLSSVRFSPGRHPGRFQLDRVQVMPVRGWHVALWRTVDQKPGLLHRVVALRAAGRAGEALDEVASLVTGAKKPLGSYERWLRSSGLGPRLPLDARPADADLAITSVVLATDRAPVGALVDTLESLRAQEGANWECLAHGEPTTDSARAFAAYAAEDGRFRHVGPLPDDALEQARGATCVFVESGAVLARNALLALGRSRADAAFGDHDHVDLAGVRTSPWFKSRWSRWNLLAQDYVGPVLAIRTPLAKRLGMPRDELRHVLPFELATRIVELDDVEVERIPLLLASVGERSAGRPVELARRVVEEAIERRGLSLEMQPDAESGWRLVPVPRALPSVSIVIPTRNARALVETCVRSVLERSAHPDLEVIVVDNQSDDPATLAFFEEMASEPRVRVLRFDEPFNYSRINNFAVREARGEVVCLLNNDTEILHPDWLATLLGFLDQPGVGVVGAKLLFPNDTVQHAGVVMGMLGIAGHVFSGIGRDDPGYGRWAALLREYCAVTAACLLVRRSTFMDVGGLDESSLTVAFNDVDFCLRVRDRGLSVLYVPDVVLYHHESATRGCDSAPEKAERFERECRVIAERWPEVVRDDPFYSPNLTLEAWDCGLAKPPRGARCWSGASGA